MMDRVPPTLTSQQRKQATETAIRVRRERAALKESVRSGDISVTEALKKAATSEAIAGIKVIDLIECIPSIGPVRATALMAELKISSSRRIRGLGSLQAEALMQALINWKTK